MIALAGVFLIGTLWYWLVEGWSWEDAAYMTVTQLPLDMEKSSHWETAVGCLPSPNLDGRGQYWLYRQSLYRSPNSRLLSRRNSTTATAACDAESLSRHYIICGFGPQGRQIALEFEAEGVPFVTIDSDIESSNQQQLGYTAPR